MAILSDVKARNLKPDDKPVSHGGVTGLVLHPGSMKGHGKWVLRYVSPVTGKRRNSGLGSYPEVGVAEAGRRGQEMREQLTKGLDPLEEKAKATTVIHIPTFLQAAETLHADLLPGWKNKKHGQQWINTIRQYAVPTLGALPVNHIEPRHIADTLRPIWLEKAETANRLKQRLHAVMAWAWVY
ncbi:integrase arm-type DNA-binding domain-containing protein [Microvirgula aerodenitrificans]|uniref:tyrosine-type recombinase/integrase n=1 Tax=Microvirgula aerodenitrificans TaxID=57480 RepID=UPI0028E9C1E1|nr:integrase arm-type DNA-binding domain-containing protein [Microvirgula aerodenitrificans]